jgi:hypothetical protein
MVSFLSHYRQAFSVRLFMFGFDCYQSRQCEEKMKITVKSSSVPETC